MPESEAASGTFVVTHADDETAVMRDVDTARVHALSSNPGVDVGDVIEGTLAPDPPLEVAWQLVGVEERRSIERIRSDLEPTARSRELGEGLEAGEVTRDERAGSGEVHVLSVPHEDVEAAVDDVLEDPETLARAARIGAVRVEVRQDGGRGILSVRYLPD